MPLTKRQPVLNKQASLPPNPTLGPHPPPAIRDHIPHTHFHPPSHHLLPLGLQPGETLPQAEQSLRVTPIARDSFSHQSPILEPSAVQLPHSMFQCTGGDYGGQSLPQSPLDTTSVIIFAKSYKAQELEPYRCSQILVVCIWMSYTPICNTIPHPTAGSATPGTSGSQNRLTIMLSSTSRCLHMLFPPPGTFWRLSPPLPLALCKGTSFRELSLPLSLDKDPSRYAHPGVPFVSPL